jgi:hypothetical protein
MLNTSCCALQPLRRRCCCQEEPQPKRLKADLEPAAAASSAAPSAPLAASTPQEVSSLGQVGKRLGATGYACVCTIIALTTGMRRSRASVHAHVQGPVQDVQCIAGVVWCMC